MPVDAKKVVAGCTCCGPDGYMPKVTFSTFVFSLYSSALVHLGEAPEPESGQVHRNMPLAKHTIDILAMLKCKTGQCLEAEESRLLDEVLCELRLRYVRCQ